MVGKNVKMNLGIDPILENGTLHGSIYWGLVRMELNLFCAKGVEMGLFGGVTR